MARRLASELLIMVALGVVLGLLGPFGSFALSAGERILYWVIWIVAGYLIYRPLGLAAYRLCDHTCLPHYLGSLLAIALAALPITLMVTMMSQHMGFGEALRWRGLWIMYGYIAVISAIVTLATNGIMRKRAGDTVSEAVAPPEAALPETANTELPPAALAAPLLPLPPGFGAVIALKGEDHYVRAYGDAGHETLLLMRLRDAVAQMPEGAGLQVHRSWWVARAGVASITREGRGAVIRLAGGQEVPVARDAVAMLKAVGWL